MFMEDDDVCNNPIYICDVCGCWFSSKQQYILHTNSHYAFIGDEEDVNRITINTTDSKEFTNLKELIECDFQIGSLMNSKSKPLDYSSSPVSGDEMDITSECAVNKICQFYSPKCHVNLKSPQKQNSTDAIEQLDDSNHNCHTNDLSDNKPVAYAKNCQNNDDSSHIAIHNNIQTPVCRLSKPEIKLLSMEMECKRKLFHFKGTRNMLPVLSLHRQAIKQDIEDPSKVVCIFNYSIP